MTSATRPESLHREPELPIVPRRGASRWPHVEQPVAVAEILTNCVERLRQ